MSKRSCEFLIIGSGFGGAFAAHTLAKAGRDVVVVERGRWVVRDDSCWDEERLHLKNPLYRGHTPVFINQHGNKIEEYWPDDTVGGMSPFYGAAAFRMREEDFFGAPLENSAQRDPKTSWPFTYSDLAPYYDKAEKLQFVAGTKGDDITEPPRSMDFPQPAPALSLPSQKIYNAARKLGLHPFHIPLAINFRGDCGKGECVRCHTCDHYCCKVEAKNDLSVVVLPEAISAGARVLDDTRALKINLSKRKAVSVELVNQRTGERYMVNAKCVVLACGALATPHLLLASGIDKEIPAGEIVGRFLMRHANGVVSGIGITKANPKNEFHKQIAISDYYFGDPQKKRKPIGNWGLIQEIHTPGKGVMKANVPWGLKNVAAFTANFLYNLLCIAEDQPQYDNRVYIDNSMHDKFGMPLLRVYHRYTKRDIAARNALYSVAKRILFAAGTVPVYCYHINTFSHAIGTCRFGINSSTSVLDPECRVWGIKNLFVLDGSFMPSGGSVNPSLTIAANSLRVADILKDIR
ncbi:MAG: GMC family oxidoreductase [Spirochaetes bacterium]|nr:GMC family oxidoreductase [Spirochaetota bacterium]